eukprot:1226645-Pleurochrysis_carterae.AAC.1
MTVWGFNVDLRGEIARRFRSKPATACIVTEAEPPFAICAVNSAWTHLCGYDACEVLGKSPKILQGQKTNYDKAAEFTRSLSTQLAEGPSSSATVVLVNYTKSGAPFAHRLRTEAVTDKLSGKKCE